MYINGVLAAVGPCKRTAEIKYYDIVDITKYLKIGVNNIEIQVLQLSNDSYHRGENLLQTVICDGMTGLCLWGNIGDVNIETNEKWLTAKETGVDFFREPIFSFYNVAALCENISVYYRKNIKFEKAVELQKLSVLDEEEKCNLELPFSARKRPIPMMYFKEKEFIAENDNIYDAGELTCGYVRLKLTGNGKARITYAECMAFIENGRVKKRKRDDKNGVIIGNYDILEVEGECSFEPFWMRTFRYIEIKTEGNIQIDSFDYIETGYPIDVSDKYDFGHDKDNKLFDISMNTLKRCMHETYMDCPYYEQLQYTMDTYLQILFTYQLTKDKALPEKAIDDFAKSYRVGDLTQSRYPTTIAQYIPGFSMFFIMMLYEHSARFGDREFLRKYIHIADGIVDWFVNRFDGYMVSGSNFWDFIDWSEEYTRGSIQSDRPIAVYSLMLSYTLEKLSDMHNMLGIDVPEYKLLSNKIRQNVKERCFDKEKGLYADSPGKKHFAQHTQIWAVLCDIETEESAKSILIKSMELKCKVSSAYMFFLFRAFEKAGIYELSEEYMDSLRSLVDLGCTTTPEWIGEDVRSECHAWSAVAIYEFTAKVLGVTYKDGIIQINPYVKGRNYAKGEVATPVGMVYCEWEKNDNLFCIKLEIPENKNAVLILPDGSVIDAQNGIYRCDLK